MKTTLLVRPAARGGKYLGPDAAPLPSPSDKGEKVYSALVLLTDNQSGEVVAAQFVDATSPNDAGPVDLMAPVSRAIPFGTDGNTIGVTFEVDIDVPTVYTVQVFGPLRHIDQARLATADITLLPGVNVGATSQFPEGVVIEVPGLCISEVTLGQASAAGTQTLSCYAKVTMMCGCPIEAEQANQPPPVWPATSFTVNLVTITQSGNQYIYPLSFDTAAPPSPDGKPASAFNGVWNNQAPSEPIVDSWIYASEASLGNQGFYHVGASKSEIWCADENIRHMVLGDL